MVRKCESGCLVVIYVVFDGCYYLQTAGAQSWVRGSDYFRMDGSSSAQSRRDLSDSFNDSTNIRLVLVLCVESFRSEICNLINLFYIFHIVLHLFLITFQVFFLKFSCESNDIVNDFIY